MSQQTERFGKYILFERLAAGGMAEVYLSKSMGAVGVNKFVAIKRILPQYSDHHEFINMFKEEAKIAVNLNHSNVVSIHDFGVEKNQFYLVMEYVEGRNLRQILNELKKTQKQFTIEQSIFIIKEVAAGLDYAHRCVEGSTGRPLNIVHRDMSPQNIMVSFEGGVKIIDFGIAKAETQLEATKVGTLKGKYGYMSPEQADGQSIDSRTDIFSVGIVLWELLANDRLFTGNSESAILRKLRECQVPSIRKINPNVPPELEAIVNKALAKDKNLRYQNAAALNRDLNKFLNTKYPDFSQHDFSVFIKNAFTSTFLELRKKLVDYSKVQPISDEKGPSSAAPTETLTGTDNSDDNQEGKLNIDASASVSVDLGDLKSKNGKRPAGRPTGNTSIGQVSSNTGQWGNTVGGPVPLTPRASQKGTPSTQAGIGSFIGRMVKAAVNLVLLLAFAVGGFWAFRHYGLQESNQNIIDSMIGLTLQPIDRSKNKNPVKNPTDTKKPPQGPQANTNPDPGRTPTTDPGKTPNSELSSHSPQPAPATGNTSLAEYVVQIKSQPDRARVVINGEDTGGYTPMRKTLKGNMPVNVRLVKEGFSDFVTTYTPTTDVGTINGTLQRLGRVATMYVKLVNGGVSPELRISGIPVELKPETEPYIVQAEVNIKVQAKNKVTGFSAEKTVLIRADQKDIVELYLK